MKKRNDLIIFGLAMFAMFFGAGNLIFPPEIGITAGKEWIVAMVGFFLTGICLPVCGLIAFSKAGSIDKFADKVSPRFNTIYFGSLIFALCPMLAIPRTAATAYEMGISPNISGLNPIIISIIYFAIVYIIVIRPSKLIDIIGKFLTPIILSILGFIIIKGSIIGLGVPGEKLVEQNSFSHGFLGGYQTMDAITSVVLGSIIVKALKEHGYNKEKDRRFMIVRSGLMSGIGMALVYGGLLYLGSRVNGRGLDISRSELVVLFARETMGQFGIIALGICVTLACITTAAALTAINAEFFSKKTKLSYKTVTLLTCVFATILGSTGVGFIIDLAVPILTILYPVVIILIALNVMNVESKKVFRASSYTGLSFGILEVIAKSGLSEGLFNLFNLLPLATAGFAWLFPTLIATSIALVIKEKKEVYV